MCVRQNADFNCILNSYMFVFDVIRCREIVCVGHTSVWFAEENSSVGEVCSLSLKNC